MPRPQYLLATLLAIVATPLRADMDFVTDRAICPLSSFERQERGMSFNGRQFWEIEYHCELAEPLSAAVWNSDQTHITPGYCEEPGALFPAVFVLRLFQSEPGILYVYQDQTGEPTVFYQCGM